MKSGKLGQRDYHTKKDKTLVEKLYQNYNALQMV
jgi:hypothetical protein